ncbi:MAG: hypothetical protein K1000chlam1_01083 [Candidatus Anoxychlamydiales bacterium]|nr:hypothetical protein [Candidatus Anoxychlamydiales bacterium]
MASLVSWKLPQRIIDLSQADNWPAAIREWKAVGIEELEDGEDNENCLCGHVIRTLCFVENRTTSKGAIVGNHCIKKFKDDEFVGGDLKSVPKIFDALKRIKKDSSASANKELIEYAESQNIFSSKDSTFYNDIYRKRKLSGLQENYKQNLNQRLIYAIATAAKTSFNKLKKDSSESANPKLLKYALKKEILTQNNYDFYMQIWMRAHRTLSEKQKTYKIGLNNRIIAKLSSDFDQGPIASSSSANRSENRRTDKGEEED